MNRETRLRRRIGILTGVFIAGLIVSGATALPLVREVNWLAHGPDHPPAAGSRAAADLGSWILRVRDGLNETAERNSFLFYGTDWLAFGHFVIAIAFVGALREPVSKLTLFEFGLIACASVIPYAWICGAIRGIPAWWRLVDCSFGLFGAVPLWLCRRWALELQVAARGADSGPMPSSQAPYRA
jgi:hypothetical protein